MKKNNLILLLLILMVVPFINAVDIEPGQTYEYNYTWNNTQRFESFYCKPSELPDFKCGDFNMNVTCPSIPEPKECPICEQKTDYLNFIVGILILIVGVVILLLMIFNQKNKAKTEEKEEVKKGTKEVTLSIPEGMTMQEYIDSLKK